MIHRVSFQNFRGFKHLELSELAPITLLSGENNAGKSTVLDGLFLLGAYNDPLCFTKLCNFRNLPVVPDFDVLCKPLFYQLNVAENIQICADGEYSTELTYYREDSYSPLLQDFKGMPQESLNQLMFSARNNSTLGFELTQAQKDISYKETGHFIMTSDGIGLNMNVSPPNNPPNNQAVTMPLMVMLNSTSTARMSPTALLGKLELDGRKNEILDILRKMDPNLLDITVIDTNGQTQLYGNMNGKLLPLRLAGVGINRLLIIMLSLMVNPNSIILIDEIENGFYYSMFPVIWEAIAHAAKGSNSQVIATTHSYECVSGAAEGMERANRENDFCLYRLEQDKDSRKAYRFSANAICTALDMGLEVR